MMPHIHLSLAFRRYSHKVKGWNAPVHSTVAEWIKIVFLYVSRLVSGELAAALAWALTSDGWSKALRHFQSANAFYIDRDWYLRRVSFGVQELKITKEDTIKTAKDQAAGLKVLFSTGVSFLLGPAQVFLVSYQPSPKARRRFA